MSAAIPHVTNITLKSTCWGVRLSLHSPISQVFHLFRSKVLAFPSLSLVKQAAVQSIYGDSLEKIRKLVVDPNADLFGRWDAVYR